MERKLERCIRLRFVSLCTCVCTCMSMCGNDLPSFDQNKTSIDRRKKKNKIFLFAVVNTSLGAFARWKAPSIPRWTTMTKRATSKNAMPASVAAMVRAFAWFCFEVLRLCFAGLVVI